MDTELIIIILTATLPIYPALFVIYQKIGKYDVMCEVLGRLQEDYYRFHYGEGSHGPTDCSDHRDDCSHRGSSCRLLATLAED